MPQFKNTKEVKGILIDQLENMQDMEQIWETINETTEKYIGNLTARERTQQDILKLKKRELDLDKKTQKTNSKIFETYGKIRESFNKLITGDKLKEATEEFVGRISEGFSKVSDEDMAGVQQSGFATFSSLSEGFGSLSGVASKSFSKIKGIGIASFGILKLAGIGALTGIIVLTAKLFQQFNKIDEAVASIAKQSGVLDNRLSSTLIDATKHAGILGGDIQIAADVANELYEQLSPSIDLTGKLVGNIANISERFGLGVENATKFTRIVSELTNTTIADAASQTERIIDDLGRLGPAVVDNIVQGYDTVINSFAIGLNQLKGQALAATQLGISLESAAETAKGLLDISSSIQSQFKASALLGQDLNLNRARQLAFEGKIVEANQEILDQVEKLGGLHQFNYFQRQAIAEATGKTIAELQRELQIRKQIGRVGSKQAARRRSVLTKFEAIGRRIQSAFFKILTSKTIQNTITNFTNRVVDFLESPRFNKFIKGIASFVEAIGKLILNEATLNPWGLFTGADFYQSNTKNSISRLNDGIITNRGEIVTTNPKDYIIATQTPADLLSGGGASNEVMKEVVSLLKHLKENGVKSGDTYLDGKKVSKKLAMANRHG